MKFSPLLDEMMKALQVLPGVGPKSAQRMAFTLLERERSGDPVLQVRRVLAYAGVPTILEELWLPGAPFKGLTAERLSSYSGPMYALFETEFGVRMVRADENIRAVNPDTEQAQLLKVDTTTPLLSVERVAYTYNEELSVAWLYPKAWNGRVVIWLDDAGKSGIANPQVKELVKGGAAVLGVDLLFQGTELAKQNRLVANPREFAGYTYGYNNALFAQRAHDVLTLTSFLRNTKVGTHPSPKSVCIAAFGEQTGPIAVAACALAGEHVDRAAVDTHGFRFGKVLDYRDPMFLPGGAKYRDLPGMVSLYDPNRSRVKGEGKDPEGSAVEWLLK